MTAEVLRFLKQHLPQDARIVCAVSGGPDSMALLHAAVSLQDTLHLHITCAHFNHRLRGAQSEADEVFVQSYCSRSGIAFARGEADVAHEASQTGESVEEAARRLRYDFLLGLDPQAYLLTAHTADDNLETMLMHLIRGASLKGLSGIPPVRGRILRPMLRVTREDVLAYLDQTNTPYRIDASNDSDDYLRNRVRHAVIPLLQAENPSIAQRSQAAAERMRQEDALLEQLASQALDDAMRSGELSCQAFLSQPDALQRRMIRQLLQKHGISDFSSRHIESICALAASCGPSARIDLPGGWSAARRYDRLVFVHEAPPEEFSPVCLQVPGVTEIPALCLRICCQIAQPGQTDEFPCDFAVHYTGADICVRPRQTGDALRRTGGTKTLKKLMIDRKIPAEQRSRIPVFADADGVLAVPDFGVSLDRLPKPDQPVLYIQIEKDDRLL